MNSLANLLTRLSFLALLISILVGPLVRWQLSQTTALQLIDLALFSYLFCSTYLLVTLSTRTKLPQLFWIIPAFTLVGTLSLLHGYINLHLPLFPGSLYLLRWFLYATTAPLTYTLIKQKLFPFTHTVLLTLCVLIALIGLTQFTLLPDTRFLFFLGWDNHLNRLISTPLDPAFTGLFLIFGFLLNHHTKHSPLLSSLFVISLTLTYSRASFVSFASILVVQHFIGRRKNSWRWLIIFLLLIPLLPRTAGEGVKLERTQSIVSRLTSNRQAWQLFQKHPLFGVGFNQYATLTQDSNLPYPDHANSPDNSFLLLLSTTGLPGFLIFSFWFYHILSQAHPNQPLLFDSTLVLILHSLANNSLFHPHLSLFYWLLFTLCLIHPATQKKPPQT